MNLICIFIGCAIGNFLYQAIFDRDWGRAAIFSYMQGVPLVALYMLDNVRNVH
jgi:hypothetical protein